MFLALMKAYIYFKLMMTNIIIELQIKKNIFRPNYVVKKRDITSFKLIMQQAVIIKMRQMKDTSSSERFCE